jgi:hypothetical protein
LIGLTRSQGQVLMMILIINLEKEYDGTVMENPKEVE